MEAVAARRLIDVKDLADALAWSPWPDEVAEELWVDRAMVEARMDALTEDERAYLAGVLEAEHPQLTEDMRKNVVKA